MCVPTYSGLGFGYVVEFIDYHSGEYFELWTELGICDYVYNGLHHRALMNAVSYESTY